MRKVAALTLLLCLSWSLQYCITHGGEPGYRLILETMLPLLAKLLGDRQEEVSHAVEIRFWHNLSV